MSLRNNRASLKILLAEDNRFNQEIALLTLKSAGHTVEVAATGREVIEKWMDGDYDLILMDLEMPDIDGLEAATAIRRMEKAKGGHTPIFAVSAHAKTSHMQRCLAAGMDDYIAKPIRIADLTGKIKNLPFKTSNPGSNGATKNLPFDLSPLRRMFSENEVRDLVGLFLSRGKTLIGEIDEAIAEKDAKSLRIKAHQFKGSSSQMHATPLANAAAKLENLAETGDIEGADSVFMEMKAVFEETAHALKKDIQG